MFIAAWNQGKSIYNFSHWPAVLPCHAAERTMHIKQLAHKNRNVFPPKAIIPSLMERNWVLILNIKSGQKYTQKSKILGQKLVRYRNSKQGILAKTGHFNKNKAKLFFLVRISFFFWPSVDFVAAQRLKYQCTWWSLPPSFPSSRLSYHYFGIGLKNSC